MDLKKRMDALNRRPLPARDRSDADLAGIRRRMRKLRSESEQKLREPILYRRDLPRESPPPPGRRRPNGPPVRLEEEVPGREVPAACGGRAYVVEHAFGPAGEARGGPGAALAGALRAEGSPLWQRVGALCTPGAVGPEDLLFVDVESTGLAGTALFLIGVLVWEGDGLVVRQFFARDYSEEPAVIAHFLEAARPKRLIVSFNGKSFDIPYIRVRAAATGVPFDLAGEHMDLLHACRRAWRAVLPDCRLQTLERRLCGRRRRDDIPGQEIPEAYHEYVRTGNAADMLDVLAHNQQDLLTLAELMVKLPPPAAP